jgi:hypothetical protein
LLWYTTWYTKLGKIQFSKSQPGKTGDQPAKNKGKILEKYKTKNHIQFGIQSTFEYGIGKIPPLKLGKILIHERYYWHIERLLHL